MKLDVKALSLMYAAIPADTPERPFDLRDVLLWSKLKREISTGMRPRRGLAGTARLNLVDYVADGAQAPDAVHRSHLGFQWGALMNDMLGDCGPAMLLHAFEAWALDSGNAPPPFSDQDALGVYEKVGQYVPGNPATDRGVDNTNLFDYAVSPGVLCAKDESSHKIVEWIAVPADPNLMRVAIWEFVVLFRAYNMPVSAQGQHEWQVTDPSLQGSAAPGSWGGHDVPILSYDTRRFRTVSWGTELLIEAPVAGGGFDGLYGQQAIVGITEDMLNRQGVSPSGVNWTKLGADLRALPTA